MAEKLIEIIAKCENLIIDEASACLLSTLPELCIPLKLNKDSADNFTSFLSYLEFKYELNSKIQTAEKDSTNELFWVSIKKIAEAIDKERAKWERSPYEIYFDNPLKAYEIEALTECIHEVWEILKNHSKGGKLLWKMLPLLCDSPILHITYRERTSAKGVRREHFIKPIHTSTYSEMLATNNHFAKLLGLFSNELGHRYAAEIQSDKRVIITDACIPDIKLYRGAFGRWLMQEPIMFDWGDPLKTNYKQVIICDSKTFSIKKYFKKPKGKYKSKSPLNADCINPEQEYYKLSSQLANVTLLFLM